jgi:hypothetical protein
MWLYIPERLSASSPASAPLIWPLPESSPDAEPWLMWRGKATQRPSSLRGWRLATWTTLLSGLTSAHSQAELSEIVSIWWQGASPAPTSPWPAKERESTPLNPASSSSLPESFATYDPATSSWRTSQPSLLDELSTPFSERWPSSGSMRSGGVCERPTLARHMAATGGGASRGTESNWPTITVDDSESGQTKPNPNRQGGAQHESLRVAAAQWPTPTRLDSTNTANRTATRSSADSKHHDGVTLIDAIRMWPTPHGFNGQDKDGGYGTGGEFKKFCKLWATPAAGVFNDSETPESWNARADRLKEKHQNGNGAGKPLGIQAQEFGPASRPDPTTETTGDASSPSTPTSRLRLNARFVEVLMGLRPGWTCVCAPASIDSEG